MDCRSIALDHAVGAGPFWITRLSWFWVYWVQLGSPPAMPMDNIMLRNK